MTSEIKFLGIILTATLVILFGGVYFLSNGQSSSQSSNKQIESATISQIDYSKGEKTGSDSAKIKLVEFSDLQCPACSAVEPLVEKIRATYADKIQFIYMHFPLPQHSHGREAAYLAEAAGEQGKFWEMHDKLFETQTEWSALPDATPYFLNLAKGLNLDENKIKQALSDNAYKSKIDGSVAEGNRLGVNSTPTFFLNGRKLNLQSFDDLNTAITEELNK